MMKNNNNATTLSYTISDTIVCGIMTTIGFLLLTLCILYVECELWVLMLIGGSCLLSTIETLHCFIIDFTITFNKEGFIVNKHNRLTSNDKMQLYKWNEIHSLAFLSLYSKHGTPRLHVFYKGGGSDEIGFRYTIKHQEFTKLARYYSGREGIIKKSVRKRKPFEKN